MEAIEVNLAVSRAQVLQVRPVAVDAQLAPEMFRGVFEKSYVKGEQEDLTDNGRGTQPGMLQKTGEIELINTRPRVPS